MKVLFISPSFFPATYYGGPIFINRAFCESLSQCPEVDVRVLTTDADGPKRIDRKSLAATNNEAYSVQYCRRVFSPDIAPGLLLRLPGLIRNADVVHLNGVYSFTTLPALALCRLFRKPLVWSTLGALQRWEGTARTKLKKRWERVCNWLATPQTVVMHVTSEEEKTESLEKIPNAGVLILRNGIEVPGAQEMREFQPGDPLRLLYLGRLHPIKGIENLLRSLVLVKTDFTLSICGAGEPEYEARLRALVQSLGLTDRVIFHGQVDAAVKEQHFQKADLCVAPSFKEAFCTVVLEALARGVPVIAGHGTPWGRVEEVGCGLWAGNDPVQLAEAIDHLSGLPLAEMGRRGREWMIREFAWTEVAHEMVAEYRKLIEANRRNQPRVATQTKTA